MLRQVSCALIVCTGLSWPGENSSAAEFVRVGQPGNPADSTGLGRVDETFEIQRCEVTWTEYAAFLNAVAAEADPYGLWNASMQHSPSGGLAREGNSSQWRYVVKPEHTSRPAVWVSWHDAARYCNWLHHGAAPGGETEHGAYELRGKNPRNLIRSESARFFLPSADEWHKAAYHEPDPHRRGASRYWMYPTRSDYEPFPEEPPGGTNSARLGLFGVDSPPTVLVGSYPTTVSGWGVADLAGNVWEWIETGQGARGASAKDGPPICAATHPGADLSGTFDESPTVGFRVARRPLAPALEEMPASQAIRLGSAAEWRASVTGEFPLAIQWRLGQELWVTGEICRVFLPSNSARLGPFTLVATNRHGRAESEPFFLLKADPSEGRALHFDGNWARLAELGGKVRYHGTSARRVPGRRGDEGGAVAFDGQGALRLPFPAQPQGTTPRTLAAWVRIESQAPSQPAFAHFGMGNWDGRMFGLGVSEQQPWFWGGSRDLSVGLPVAPGQWHFLAVVYDPPWMDFWVDDQSARKRAPELATVFNGGLWLGADTVNDGLDFRGYFQGRLDEVWVYDRALSPDELSWLREGE